MNQHSNFQQNLIWTKKKKSPEDGPFLSILSTNKGVQVIVRSFPLVFQQYVLAMFYAYLRNLCFMLSIKTLQNETPTVNKFFQYLGNIIAIIPVTPTVLALQSIVLTHSPKHLVDLLHFKVLFLITNKASIRGNCWRGEISFVVKRKLSTFGRVCWLGCLLLVWHFWHSDVPRCHAIFYFYFWHFSELPTNPQPTANSRFAKRFLTFGDASTKNLHLQCPKPNWTHFQLSLTLNTFLTNSKCYPTIAKH